MSDEPIQYIINSTYKNLEQPYSEQHIKNINQPPHKLYVWDNQLLMNFQLYALNKQSTNAFEVNQLQFVSAYHAISWVCSRQLMRSDLTEEYRKYLYSFSNLIGTSDDYTFFNDYYIQKMSEIDAKYEQLHNELKENVSLKVINESIFSKILRFFKNSLKGQYKDIASEDANISSGISINGNTNINMKNK